MDLTPLSPMQTVLVLRSLTGLVLATAITQCGCHSVPIGGQAEDRGASVITLAALEDQNEALNFEIGAIQKTLLRERANVAEKQEMLRQAEAAQNNIYPTQLRMADLHVL